MCQIKTSAYHTTTLIKKQFEDLENLKKQVNENQAQASSNSTSVRLEGSLPRDLQSLLNNLDPAFKQIAFVGFTDDISALDRADLIKEFCRNKLPGFVVPDVGHFPKGPINNRTLSPASFAEFKDADSARAALRFIRDNNLTLGASGNNKLKIKATQSQLNKRRDFALRNADRLIKADPASNGKIVKIEFKDRQVKLDDNIVFSQEKHEVGGTFSGDFSHLRLQ